MSVHIDAQSVSQLKHGILPEVFAGGAPRTIRVWVPECGEGHDAYRIAMLLSDYVEVHGLSHDVRVFATDSRIERLAAARLGHYDASLIEEQERSRLHRYLVATNGGYQVVRRIRDCLLFSTHDSSVDPPFSNLDLLLGDAAFEREQGDSAQLLRLFHYALAPRGFLVLRPENGPRELLSFFHAVEPGVFRARQDRPSMLPPLRAQETPRRRSTAGSSSRPPPLRERSSLGALVRELLLERHAPPCLVLNEEGEIIYSSGKTSRYLHNPNGLPTSVLLQMLRPELVGLVSPLLEGSTEAGERRVGRAVVTLEGEATELKLSVHRLAEPGSERKLTALVFEETPQRKLDSPEVSRTVQELRFEIESAREEALRAREEFATSAEELQASNEELRSLNEELETSNNELATIRDQLFSVNEELETVNQELAFKVKELERANDDIRNLFDSSQVATIFLDRELCIGNFTPAVQDLFALIPADKGRPLTDVAQRFRHDELIADALYVMRAREMREAQVQSLSKRWYILRMLPYCSSENHVAGVVLTFVDVTLLKRAELEVERLGVALENQLRWLRSLVDIVPVGIGFYEPQTGQLKLNRAGAKLVDLPKVLASAAEPLGFAWDAAVAASPEQARLRDWMTSSERVDGAALELTLATGAQRHLVVHSATVPGEGQLGGGKLSALLDTTESVLRQRALEEARRHESEAASQREVERQLERSQRLASLGTFATGIAHELNNPLSNVALSADYAISTRDEARRAKLLQNVRANALRCGRIVESVLRFARDEASERSPNELNAIIQRAADLARSYCPELRISLALAEPAAVVACNPTEIEQVFVSLLKNAAQARPSGCVVEVRSELRDERVKICVSDNGPGIPESVRERIFDPFFSTQRANGGTGLGLSITYRIVATHGGSIRVDNVAGSGAIFEIELPLTAR